MAARVLRRAAALGLAAATAGSLHGVATLSTPEPVPTFRPSPLLESTLALQVALLRARPLYGACHRDVTARAELDLARADAAEGPGRDPAAATDLRLLLALLAARDGSADDALRLYAEAARDSPFDRRPRCLAYHILAMSGRHEEAKAWRAAYRRLVADSEIVNPNFPGYESKETKDLVHELVVAASVGGVCDLSDPMVRYFVLQRAHYDVHARLQAAAQDESLSMAERLQLRAFRVCLDAILLPLLTKAADTDS